MKNRANKPTVVINIFSGNEISLDGKTARYVFIVIVILILVVSKYEPSLLANMIRSLSDIANKF